MKRVVLSACPDCDAAIGEWHGLDCDLECCPYCGNQLLSCEHCLFGKVQPPPLDDRLPWTGEQTGVAECREFGWYAKLNPNGKGWVPCEADHPQAIEDLNRLRVEARWSRKRKRWVKREGLVKQEPSEGQRRNLPLLGRAKKAAEARKWRRPESGGDAR